MQATACLQVDNERVIVKEWRVALGAETGHPVQGHDHTDDYPFSFIEIEVK